LEETYISTSLDSLIPGIGLITANLVPVGIGVINAITPQLVILITDLEKVRKAYKLLLT
jgi:hypothetical protein